MSASLLGLGKLLFTVGAGFGIAYPFFKISAPPNNTAPRDLVTTSERGNSSAGSQREAKAPETKNCKIFLISTDKIYTLVYCQEANSKNTWYLYNSSSHLLDPVNGLTSDFDNSGQTRRATDENFWKPKQWQGFKGRDGKGSKVGSKFQISYNSGNSFNFPFFDILKTKCLGGGGSDWVQFKFCQTFDLPNDKLDAKTKTNQPILELNGTNKCFIKQPSSGRVHHWKEHNCSNLEQH